MKLHHSRRLRDASRCFVIEGIRQFVQACDAQHDFDTIIHSPILLKCGLARKLMQRHRGAGAACISVTPEQFQQISTTEHASGIAAIVKQRWTSLASASPRHGLCWLALERVQSPGNFGTILRTAEATGVAGVIVLAGDCDPFHPAVVRASMGGIFHLRLARTSYANLRNWATMHSAKLIGLSPRGEELWIHDRPTTPPVVLIGEERRGLSDHALSICDSIVRLPMSGRADSLNIGVAAGVMIYELMRQKNMGITQLSC